jgi:hypothetical protein
MFPFMGRALVMVEKERPKGHRRFRYGLVSCADVRRYLEQNGSIARERILVMFVNNRSPYSAQALPVTCRLMPTDRAHWNAVTECFEHPPMPPPDPQGYGRRYHTSP